MIQSHLIPKLVYRRIRSHPNSKFRSMDNFTKEMQDGEKRKMLCHNCEELFSASETWFANNFLNSYMQNNIIPYVEKRNLDYYIISVAWRILWDDLYRLNSFDGAICRVDFEIFERKCRDFLLNGGSTKFFQNNVYNIRNLMEIPDTIEDIVYGSLFGYAVDNPYYGKFIIVYYAGLVFVTSINENRFFKVLLMKKNKSFEDIIKDELLYEFSTLIKKTKEELPIELKEKIKKRYNP